MHKRDVTGDVMWGLRRGVVFSALLLLPGFLIALSRSESLDTLGRIAVRYLLLGGAGGALGGLCRPFAKKDVGAMVRGSILGAASLDTPHPGVSR